MVQTSFDGVIIHQKTTDLRNSIVVKSEDGELKNADFPDDSIGDQW